MKPQLPFSACQTPRFWTFSAEKPHLIEKLGTKASSVIHRSNSPPCSLFFLWKQWSGFQTELKDDNRQIRVNGKKCKWRSSRFCGIIKSDVKWQNGLVYTRWRCHLYDDGVETALKIQNAGFTSSIFKDDLRIARNRKTCPKTFIQASGTINVVGKLYANIIRRMLLGHSHNSQN